MNVQLALAKYYHLSTNLDDLWVFDYCIYGERVHDALQQVQKAQGKVGGSVYKDLISLGQDLQKLQTK